MNHTSSLTVPDPAQTAAPAAETGTAPQESLGAPTPAADQAGAGSTPAPDPAPGAASAPAAQADATADPDAPGSDPGPAPDAQAFAADPTRPGGGGDQGAAADLVPVDAGPLIELDRMLDGLQSGLAAVFGSNAATSIVEELSNAFSAVSPAVAAMRLFAALLLGALVGIERESRRKPAGLRTHILVSVAACLFILISQELSNLPFGIESNMRIDPLRLIEAVTAGVAFLAAGVIFTSGGKVQNVTTGASLWMAGAIGLGCGSGQIALAGMATVIVLLVLVLLGAAESLAGTREE